MTVAVCVAHKGLQEREETCAGEVSGSHITCIFHYWRKLDTGHSNDDEDDQRPDNQSQGP